MSDAIESGYERQLGADMNRLAELERENAALRTKLSKAIVHHSGVDDAVKSVEAAVAEAVKAGRFMVAVWDVSDGKLSLRIRTTWDFPRSEFDAALKLLDENFARERPLAPSPLPLADFAPLSGISRVVGEAPVGELAMPRVNLFGEEGGTGAP